MAVTAKFVADFGSFYDAVNKAEAELKSFDAGAHKVETSLTRMANSLQGTKLIQDATLMAAAVEKIGGVSKLTEKELQRLGAQAQEAVSKMQKLGIGVPANLQAIANAAKPAEVGLSSLISTASGLAAAVGVGFSVGAVVNFGKSILADADALVKMSDKTGISIAALQRFQVAADDSGNTIEDITGAVNQMQNRLAGGDASAVGALQKLGLSLAQIQALSPDQQFIAISDALRKIQDPSQQVNIAMDLFGRQGAEVLPTLKRGFDDLKDSIVGMSEDTARTLDSWGDSIKKTFRSVSGEAADLAVKLIQLPNNIGFAGGDKNIGDILNPPSPGGKRAGDIVLKPAPPPFEGPTLELLKQGAVALDKARDAAKKLHTEIVHLKEKADELGRGTLPYFNEGLKDVSGSLDSSALDAQKMAKSIGELKEKADAIARGSLQSFNDGLEKIGQHTDDIENLKANLASIDTFVGPLGEKVGHSFKDGFADVAKSIPDTLARAFEGGGGLEGAAKSLGAQFGQIFARQVEAEIGKISVGTSVSGKGLAAGGATGAFAGVGTAASGGSTAQALGAAGLAGAGVTAAAIAGGIGAGTGAAVGSAIALGAATAGIGAAAVGAYIAFKSLITTVSDAEKEGRKLEKSFEDAFGGFSGFQKEIVESFRALGGADEEAHAAIHALFDSEKEGAEVVQRHIDALQGVVDKAEELRQAASQFGPSQSELEALAVKAKDTYDYMLRTGQYTAAQLAAALEASAKAQAKALGQPEAQARVLSEANQKTIQSIKDIQKQYDALSQGVAQEAPEEVAGVIEGQMRGQMAALEAQSKELKDKLIADGEIAADELERILSGIQPSAIHVPIEWDIPSLPGGSLTAPIPMASGGTGTVTQPTLFLAGERGREDFAFSGTGRSFGDSSALLANGGGGGQPIEVTVYSILEGDVIARSTSKRQANDMQLRSKRPAA